MSALEHHLKRWRLSSNVQNLAEVGVGFGLAEWAGRVRPPSGGSELAWSLRPLAVVLIEGYQPPEQIGDCLR